MIEYGIKFSMSSRSLIFQESRVSLGRTLPRQLVWERVDYLCSYSASGCFFNCFTTAKRFSACSFCFYFGYISFSRFPRCSPQKNRNALNLSPHFKLRQKKTKVTTHQPKCSLKGNVSEGLKCSWNPLNGNSLCFIHFLSFYSAKNKKRKWTKL